MEWIETALETAITQNEDDATISKIEKKLEEAKKFHDIIALRHGTEIEKGFSGFEMFVYFFAYSSRSVHKAQNFLGT